MTHGRNLSLCKLKPSWLPMIIFGLASLGSAVCSYFHIETRNMPTCKTVKEAEDYYKSYNAKSKKQILKILTFLYTCRFIFQFNLRFDNHIVLFIFFVIFCPVLNFSIGKNQIKYTTKGKNRTFEGFLIGKMGASHCERPVKARISIYFFNFGQGVFECSDSESTWNSRFRSILHNPFPLASGGI